MQSRASAVRPMMLEPLEPRQLLAGAGLTGTYFNDLSLHTAVASQLAPQINFRWGAASPASGVSGGQFSARWAGLLQPAVTQSYTFYTTSMDATRVIINGVSVINNWRASRRTQVASGTLALRAGRTYAISVEYLDNHGGGSLKLEWAGPNVARQVIPTAVLYPGRSTPIQPQQPLPLTGALRISSDGHSLITSSGRPFFYMADTGWGVFGSITRTQIDTYLTTRAAQGFNVIQATITGGDHYPDRNGQYPFINDDPTRPNETFFQTVDYVVAKAQSLGLTMAILPAWGDLIDGSRAGTQIFNASNAYTYGKWLASRYASNPYIIWALGGDASPGAYQGVYDAMAQGLQAGDNHNHLITYHPSGLQSSSWWFQSDGWVDFNMIQSGHTRDSDSYDMIAADYGKSPARAVVDAEANYEGIPSGLQIGNPLIDDYDIRKKAWWSVFAGAAGCAYGNANVYRFYPDGRNSQTWGYDTPWTQAMNSAGALDMQWVSKLMLSRPFVGRVPDQSIVLSDAGQGSDHVQSIRGADASYALVYIASGQPVTVDMSKIGGTTVRASWYNPRDGHYTSIGQYSNSGSRQFTPPGSGYGQDWVLVLDDASRGYATT